MLRIGLSGFWTPVEAGYLLLSIPAVGTPDFIYNGHWGCLLGVKRPGRGINHQSLSNSEAEIALSCTPFPLVCMVWIGLYCDILLVQYWRNYSGLYLEFCDCTNMCSGFGGLCIAPFTLFTSLSNSPTVNTKLLGGCLWVCHVCEFNIFRNRTCVSICM
jgi:hypothetical protein